MQAESRCVPRRVSRPWGRVESSAYPLDMYTRIPYGESILCCMPTAAYQKAKRFNMEYIKAAVSLRSLVKETNSLLLQKKEAVMNEPNQMRVIAMEGPTLEYRMETFSNEFVIKTLDDIKRSTAFVITDVASMNIKGKAFSYLLYKGYHSALEKGVVFFQGIDKETFSPVGTLQFSNMEENIFYPAVAPKIEESSCSALETENGTQNGKSIVFLIGHMNEKRLVYDIQRLIFDTVNNVTKHPKLQFSFTIHIAHYGGKPSRELKKQVMAIEAFTKKHVYPEYPNATFAFRYEQDASLNN